MRAFCVPLFFASVLACALGQAGDKYVLTEKEAILIHPPTQVCGYKLASMEWSSDGRYLLVQRQAPPPDYDELARFLSQKLGQREQSIVSLELFEVKSGKSTKIWEGDSATWQIRSMAWIAGTNHAFVVLDNMMWKGDVSDFPTSAIYGFTPQSPRLQLIQAGEQEQTLDFYASPTRPIGWFVRHSPFRRISAKRTGESTPSTRPDLEGTSVDSQGRLGVWRPVWMEAQNRSIGWSRDGLRAIIRGSSGVLHDPKTGIETQAADGDYYQPEPPPKDLNILFQKKEVALDGPADLLSLVWLSSNSGEPEKSALLSAGGGAVFSPTRDSVLYTQDGMAFVRRLTRVPLDKFKEALVATERTRVMTEAKECVLGFLIYAADNDGALPSPGSEWQKEIKPYMKNVQFLDGFHLTFTGNIDKVDNPAKEQIGFKQGPGGRAVAYADGHVEWIADR